MSTALPGPGAPALAVTLMRPVSPFKPEPLLMTIVRRLLLAGENHQPSTAVMVHGALVGGVA